MALQALYQFENIYVFNRVRKEGLKVRHFITVLLLSAMLFLPITDGLNHYVFSNTEDLGQTVDDIREEIVEYEETIKLLNEDIKGRLKRIEELDEELAAIERELEETEIMLVQAQERLDENTKQFSSRVRSAYMKGGDSYLEILLTAENFGDLIIRFAYLKRILDRDAGLIVAVRDERKNTEQQQLAIQDQRKNIEDRRFQMEAERRNLEDQHKTIAALLEMSRENLKEALAQVPQTERNPVYGVILDNHPSARPQHGISHASIVYEYEVEGRSTRYLALFSRLPSKVGPIRSAREHSTMIAWENNVNFVFASASRDNLDKIDEWGVSSTNALLFSAFYRDSSKRAPHNLYVNLGTLNRGTSSPGTVVRPGNLSRQGQTAHSIAIEYSPSYRVTYRYDAEKRAYKRFINSNAHRDATGEEVWARNVIIQYANHRTDFRGRPTPDIVGEGTIDYYAGGQHFTGTWKKDSPSSLTRFYYADGQEIERVYGQTWIQIVRPK